MSTPVRFQALPPLSPDKYTALAKSILDHGVLVPILVDEHGVVIDGHHRQKIAKHHDLPCPQEVKSGFTDSEKRTLALSLNIDRRQLTREQRRALVAESIKADPQLSDREHGRRTGVDNKTAAGVRAKLEATEEIPQFDKTVGADGKARPKSKPKPIVGDPAEFDDGDELAPGLTGRQLNSINRKASEPPSPPTLSGPRRKPLNDVARDLSVDLMRINNRLAKLADDDRFSSNKETIGCFMRHQVSQGLEILDRIDTAINPSKPNPAEQAQPQIGPDYIDNILPLFLQTFGPHRLEQFDASERRRVIDAMKETINKLEELERSNYGRRGRAISEAAA